jgi:5-(carboxyamino)imidazole ribonucleotide mutase
MKPLVSIIMGSTSDLPVMEKACKWLNDNQIPFEVNALSAHRTPDAVESFAKGAKERGVKVIIDVVIDSEFIADAVQVLAEQSVVIQ